MKGVRYHYDALRVIERIEVAGEAGSCLTLPALDANGRALRSEEWWLRHASGDEIVLPF